MSKDDAINIMNGSIIWLIKVVFCKFFLLYIEMGQSADLTYYQKNRDLILNKAKDFYKNTKERPREQVRDKYRSLSEEEKKIKKKEYRKKRYNNMSEEEKKKKLKEYQKDYYNTKKSQYNNELKKFFIFF